MLFKKRRTYQPLSDDELIVLYKEKASARIIGELYNRYAHLVMGVSMKYLKNRFDAEDLTMVVFEKLPQRIAMNDITYFKSWLYMVTKNECLMLLRKNTNITVELTQELESKDTLGSKQDQEVKFSLLDTAINQLKEEQRDCINLFYIERKSYLEISMSLNTDIKTVKSAIQNGKRNLKITLEKRHEFKSTI